MRMSRAVRGIERELIKPLSLRSLTRTMSHLMKDYNPAFKRKRKLASEIPVGLPSTETVSIQTT